MVSLALTYRGFDGSQWLAVDQSQQGSIEGYEMNPAVLYGWSRLIVH